MAADVGEGTRPHENTLSNIGGAKSEAQGGVWASDCTASLVVHGNTFTRGTSGVKVAWNADGYVAIGDNVFHSQANGAIVLARTGRIDAITNNRFEECDLGAIVIET